MAMDWNRVTGECVHQACELVAAKERAGGSKGASLIVRHGKQELPAKQVLRVAYCFAKGIPRDSQVKFTSGDRTLRFLQSLGFDAFRMGGS